MHKILCYIYKKAKLRNLNADRRAEVQLEIEPAHSRIDKEPPPGNCHLTHYTTKTLLVKPYKNITFVNLQGIIITKKNSTLVNFKLILFLKTGNEFILSLFTNLNLFQDVGFVASLFSSSSSN